MSCSGVTWTSRNCAPLFSRSPRVRRPLASPIALDASSSACRRSWRHQFDTVLLIDVNRNEVPDGPYAAAALRKFASQIYLGASRAERVLEIYGSEEQGGLSSIITRAVLGGALTTVQEAELKKA